MNADDAAQLFGWALAVECNDCDDGDAWHDAADSRGEHTTVHRECGTCDGRGWVEATCGECDRPATREPLHGRGPRVYLCDECEAARVKEARELAREAAIDLAIDARRDEDRGL